MIGGLVDCVPGSLLAMGRHLSIHTSECGDGCVCPGLAWPLRHAVGAPLGVGQLLSLAFGLCWGGQRGQLPAGYRNSVRASVFPRLGYNAWLSGFRSSDLLGAIDSWGLLGLSRPSSSFFKYF